MSVGQIVDQGGRMRNRTQTLTHYQMSNQCLGSNANRTLAECFVCLWRECGG